MRDQNVAVREHRQVADLALARRVAIAPHNLPPAHHVDIAIRRFPRVKKIVLRQPLPRQHLCPPPAPARKLHLHPKQPSKPISVFNLISASLRSIQFRCTPPRSFSPPMSIRSPAALSSRGVRRGDRRNPALSEAEWGSAVAFATSNEAIAGIIETSELATIHPELQSCRERMNLSWPVDATCFSTSI